MTISGAGTPANTDRAATERTRAVDSAILAIEKQFGRGSIMRLGSSERQQVDAIPTGSIALDLALGVGGIPRGRITEIYGPESSGKTTLCQHVLAEAQRLAHEAGLDAHERVAHLALDLRSRHERGDRVDDDAVHAAGADEGLRDLEGLLARVRLADEQLVHVHAAGPGVVRVERVLHVDEGDRKSTRLNSSHT